MTIQAIYTSPTYRPHLVERRYVRFDSSGRYLWVETDAGCLDVRQGWCDTADLPEAIRGLADTRAGTIPGYVEWPLE